jgi:nitrite reductase/ring-hydroxylating ferredoxin subunit
LSVFVENVWYPILRSSRLHTRPITVERLGQRLVVWRTGVSVSAAPAACPHRGADLGAGRVRRGCLQCPYHGIEYSPDGRATLRPAEGPDAPIPETANLQPRAVREHKGFVWLWHGDDVPSTGPGWFDVPDPPVTVGAEETWRVHYSRFMEAALDFHHAPFVHRAYLPGVGPVVRDARLVHDGDRLKMTGALTTAAGGRRFPFEGEVLMPCALRVVAAGTAFVAVGTPVDDRRTWVAALYEPTFTAPVPGVRRLEAAIARFVDFRLFQRQDRAIFEGLPPGPSDLSTMAPMPADRGTIAWIRDWQQRLAAQSIEMESSPCSSGPTQGFAPGTRA